jgi:hypothetical protein
VYRSDDEIKLGKDVFIIIQCSITENIGFNAFEKL